MLELLPASLDLANVLDMGDLCPGLVSDPALRPSSSFSRFGSNQSVLS